MSELTEDARWWGWGREDDRPALPPAAVAALAEELGLAMGGAGGAESAQRRARTEAHAEAEASAREPALERVRLPEPRLAQGIRERLESILGAEGVRIDRLARVSHAAGKSYPDLVRLRSLDASEAPDAVLYPRTRAEVSEVLAALSEARVAVVPFGGGTSVVGGVAPARHGFAAAVSLDLARLDRLQAIDTHSLRAIFGPGIVGARAEAALAEHGLTLGHFPQSFELATIGGFLATRSAGQASTGYGRIDDLVLGLRLATPVGELVVRPMPASAAGPSLRELIVGSEGVLGVITEATLAVHRAPAERRYEGWSFRSFEQGAEAFRELAQAGAAPDIARLSDEEESRLSAALAGGGSVFERVGRAYLRARGHAGGSIAIVGFEGEGRELARRGARAARILRRAGGLALGARPGRTWERGRYAAPYLRDELMDLGAMVDTLETAASWSDLGALHRGVRDALRSRLSARGTPPLVGCHISHLYPHGASLYFTILARSEQGLEIEQWQDAKSAASDAIVAGGGTITHHHAVGRDHRPWMGAEVGELGVELLRSVKGRVDPNGVMNPGKLLPPPAVDA